MAPKVFPFNFESFEGLDYVTSPLKTSILSAQNLQNYEFSEGASIKGRPGSQLIALPGGFVGHTRFSYKNLATNAPTEELLVINDNLWKLNAYTQVISRSASATWGYRFYLDASNVFFFEITEGGSVILSSPLGSGYANSPTSIFDICTAIDALANYSVTMTFKSAKVDGTQTGVSAITVDAGHTYATNDEIEFFDYSSMKLVSRLVTATTATTITVNGPVVNVKNNQVLGAIAGTPAACVPINSTSESAGTAKTFLFYYWTRVRDTVSDTNFALGASYAPFQNFFSSRLSADWINPCFLPTRTSLHVLTEVPGTTVYEWENRPFKYDGQVCFRSGLHKAWEVNPTDSGIAGNPDGIYRYKIQYEMRDAQGYIHLGQPSDGKLSVTVATNAINLSFLSVNTDFQTNLPYEDQTGRYATINGNQATVNTIVTLAQRVFNEGDVASFVDSITGDYVFRFVTAVTQLSITISGAPVTVVDTNSIFRCFAGYNYKFAQVNGNQDNVSTLTVDTGHTLRAGDSVFIRSNDGAGAIKYQDIILSSVTATTLLWDADLYGTVYARDNEIVSCGLKVNLYRTKASGGVFYKLDTLPNDPTNPGMIYVDDKADTSLGEELVEPDLGKEFDPPPRASIATIHQGVMVYSRIRGDDGSIAFSDSIGGVETAPLASNRFAVPGGVSGPITGLGSESDNSLVTTKENAIYQVYGELESGAFDIHTIREGDYGISSHASICKINGAVVGVGPLGFVGVVNGQLLIRPEGGSLFGFNINPAIIGNSNLRLSQATAFNDRLSRHYRCFIPDVRGYDDTDNNANSLSFAYSYNKKSAWFNHYNQFASTRPSGGFSIAAIGPVNYNLYTGDLYPNYYIPHLYFLSKNFDSFLGNTDNQVPGCLFRRFSDQYPELMRYSDHCQRIEYEWLTSHETLQDPETEKEFSRIKVWSLPGNFETRAPFSVAIKSYRNFQSTILSSSLSPIFVSTSVVSVDKELALGKCQSMAFKISSTAFTYSGATTGGPFISGLSLTASLPYQKEDIRK